MRWQSGTDQLEPQNNCGFYADIGRYLHNSEKSFRLHIIKSTPDCLEFLLNYFVNYFANVESTTNQSYVLQYGCF